MKIVFTEVQKFTQWWLWILLIGIGILPIVGMYKQFVLGETFGDNPMSDLGLIIFCAVVFGLIAMFWLLRLKTEIDQNEIRINFFPFLSKKVPWNDIKSADIVNYGFVGYGIRFGSTYGTVYNTNGNTGLAIELRNGKKFVIGTQKEHELNAIVKKWKEQQHIY
jgi:hypothetical protein